MKLKEIEKLWHEAQKGDDFDRADFALDYVQKLLDVARMSKERIVREDVAETRLLEAFAALEHD